MEVKAQIRLQFHDITGQKCMVIRSLVATQKVILSSNSTSITARCYASVVLVVIMCLSVCLSQTSIYQNGYTYDHANNAAR